MPAALAVAAGAALSSPLAAQAAITPSLKNLINSVIAGVCYASYHRATSLYDSHDGSTALYDLLMPMTLADMINVCQELLAVLSGCPI